MSEKPMVEKDMADKDAITAVGVKDTHDETENAMAESVPPEDFATALSRLEVLVERLESGELSLEASLDAFEQGIRLTRDAQRRLDEAELKVRSLTERTNGELADTPFPAEEPGR